MTMTVNLKDAVVEALIAVGGSGTAAEVREHLKLKFGRDWKNIEAVMDDLCVESKSSFFPPEDRVLRNLGQGKYCLKELEVSEPRITQSFSLEPARAVSDEVNTSFEAIVTSYAAKLMELLDQPEYRFCDANAQQVPEMPGVYMIYDNSSKKQVIYVRRSRNLRRRLIGDHRKGNVEGSFFRKSLGRSLNLKDEKEISDYVIRNCSLKFLVVSSFLEAIRLEHFATAILAPTLNTNLI